MSGSRTGLREAGRRARWHRWLRFLCSLLLLPLGAPLAAQADEDYFAFWPGAWYAIENGVRDSVPTFVVRTTVNPRAFLEEWRLVIDGRPVRSIALRAWDAPSRRWKLAWVDASGLVQFWDGVKVGNDWAIQREFDGSFLSRQRWIPQGENRALRILERSNDGGRTWTTRYRTELVRAASPPSWMLGEFEDDYGSRYTITAGEWLHHPRAKYSIAEWHVEGEYLIAQNDAGNPSDGGRWTRIDWLRFADTPPYEWGFCMSAYDAATAAEAEAMRVADRATPRTGCNGHPFSRMKRVSGG